MNRRFVSLMFFTLFLLVSQQNMFAQDAKLTRMPTEASREESRAKIEAVLEVVVDLDFLETPLGEVAKKISNEFGFPVVLDRAGLDLIGVTSDEPITISISGVRLRTALDLLYEEKNLSYLIQDEVYVITSQEAAGQKLATRVYDITRFVNDVSDTAVVARTRKLASSTQRVDSLLDLIRATIVPDSWDEAGGTGTMASRKTGDDRYDLTVSQTEQCHYELKKLFETFEALQAETQETPQLADQLSLRIYPIAAGAVTAEQAKELLEFTLEGLDWSEPSYLKVIGCTLVIKQTKKVHAQINKILDDMGALPRDKSDGWE